MKAVPFEQNYFPTRIQNNQTVKKEGSYQTFKVSKNVPSTHPFAGATYWRMCSSRTREQTRKEDVKCRKQGTQAKGGLADGEGRPQDTSCVTAQTRAGQKALRATPAKS